MGILNHLLIARADEADAVAASDDPSFTWDGFLCRGLDHIKLAVLWGLIENGSITDVSLDARIDQISNIPEGDEGPWVDTLPQPMLAALASIASMDSNDHDALADQWLATGELTGWTEAEALEAVQGVGDLAEMAQLQGKTLLVWPCL
jgi:hypothetical protein